MIDSVKLERFLRLLSAVNQEIHRSEFLLLDWDDPKFYWIFKNCDFMTWNSSKAPVLWLLGPTDCGIDQISSKIVSLEMDATSQSEGFVLYFFCSTRSTITIFIHTFLHQFISYLPPDKQRAAIRAFLLILLDKQKPLCFQDEDYFSDTMLKQIIHAPNSKLWDALRAALDVEKEQNLSIIIDGLDKVEKQQPEFIKGLQELVAYLLKRRLKPKVLLTSRSQVDGQEILHGLLCIEYDKERRGLIFKL